MGYLEQAHKAIKDGKSKLLTSDIVRWEQEGQEIAGKIVAIEPFTEGQYEDPCQRYVMETDDGVLSFLLGGASDKKLREIELVGKNLYVRYRGKIQTAKGHNMNDFEIRVF